MKLVQGPSGAPAPEHQGASRQSRTVLEGVTAKMRSLKLLREHVAPLVVYLVVTLVYTYPASLHVGAMIPGRGDAYWFLWQLWWFQRSLIDSLRSPLATDRIYHPLQNVPVMWQTPVNEFFSIPLQVAVGVPVAYSLLVLASFVLSGYLMHRLLVALVRRGDVALLGGLIFAFNAYRGMRGQAGHLSLLTTQWMPLFLLVALWVWRRPSVKRGIGLGAVTALVALSTPYYVAYFLLPVGLAAGLYGVLWRRERLLDARLWRACGAGGFVAAALVTPFYVSYLLTSPEVQMAAEQASATTFVYTADLISWLLPPKHNLLWSGILAPLYAPFAEHYLQSSTLFFGFLPPILAVASLFYRRWLPKQARFWQILAGLTGLLAFGPILRVWGVSLVNWMPYRLFMALPGAYAFRAPARIGVTTIFAATVLASMVLARVIPRLGAWPRRVLLSVWGVLLVINMSPGFPFPSAPLHLPASYQVVQETTGDFAVLELPAGELFLREMSQYMYYQTVHGKKLVSGYLARRPAFLQKPTQTTPFVRRFFVDNWGIYFSGDWQNLIDWPSEATVLAGRWPEDVRNGAVILHDWGVRYVLVHKAEQETSFSESANILLTRTLGLPRHMDDDVWLYPVAEPRMWIQGTLDGFAAAFLDYESKSFSQPFLHRRVVARSVRPGSSMGRVTFRIPLHGDWRIHWFAEGALADQLRIAWDGEPIEAESVRLSETLRAFQIDLVASEGEHILTLAWTEAPSSLDASCNALCLLDLAMEPLALTHDAPEQPLAEFVNDAGQEIDLIDVAVRQVRSHDGTRTYLLTGWRSQPESAGLGSPDGPTFYVHLTDASGTTIAQADHILAEQSFRFRGENGGYVLDVVELPPEAAALDAVQLRGGLWLPKDERYFWTKNPNVVDEANRLTLGPLSAYLLSTTPPPSPVGEP